MSKSKHTPTPWKVEPKKDWDKVIRIESTGGEDWDRFYAEVLNDDCDSKVSAANAEFIVRACNAHDALVEALEEIGHAELSQPIHGSMWRALKMAGDALRLAKCGK